MRRVLYGMLAGGNLQSAVLLALFGQYGYAAACCGLAAAMLAFAAWGAK